MSKSAIKKAVIPAAGLGTRMLPATKAQRKEMLPVAGKPLLQYSVEEAASSGIETVVLITGGRSSCLLEHFKRNVALEELLESQGMVRQAELVRSLSELVTFLTVDQQSPRGLGHAVYCSRELVGDEPFALLLPDVLITGSSPCIGQLIDAQRERRGSFIATRSLNVSELRRHGVLAPANAGDGQLDRCFRVTGLVEKPSIDKTPSFFGVFGRYLLEATIFEYIEQDLSNNTGEIQLTDALDRMAKEHPVYGLQFTGKHFDAGDQLGFLKANIELSLDSELGIELRSFLEHSLRSTPDN